MSFESFILTSSISDLVSDSTYSYSDKQPGAGYHNKDDSTHTVVYSLQNFVGGIKIQASLELYPSDGDFFDIVGTELISSDPYTDAYSVTFSGNFVWLRAAYNLQDGIISEIRYNH
jgi:hypothetical protein